MSTTTICARRYSDFKLYPNVAQAEALERQRRMNCALYNAGLEEREAHWRRECQFKPKDKRRGLTFYDQQKGLTQLRAEDPDYAELGYDSLALTLQRLDRAFKAFFRRAKDGAGAQSGYPRFKRAADYPGFSLRYKKDRRSGFGGAGWDIAFRDDGRRHGSIRIKGVPGRVKFRGRLPDAPERISTCDIMWRDNAIWMSLGVDIAPRRRKGRKRMEVRFDLIDDFARVKRVDGRCASGPETVFRMVDGRISPEYQPRSDTSGAGTKDSGAERRRISATRLSVSSGAAPQESGAERRGRMTPNAAGIGAGTKDSGAEHRQAVARAKQARGAATKDSAQAQWCAELGTLLATSGARIRTIQRAMSRCKKGSCRYRKLKRRKARLQAQIRRRRKDSLHNWTTALIADATEITAIRPRDLKEATKSGRGDEREWGAQVETKAGFNRRVLDQAPGLAMAMLRYKADEIGIELREVDHEQLEVGNVLVAASKQNRKLKRSIRHASGSRRGGRNGKDRQAEAHG